MSLDVSQVRAFAAKLDNAGPVAAVKAQRVVTKTAQDIEATAKRLAPVDTGALRNSIGSTVSTLHAEIGPTVDYAVYVEYGTSRMAPQPYMGPAADKHGPAFERALQQITDEALG